MGQQPRRAANGQPDHHAKLTGEHRGHGLMPSTQEDMQHHDHMDMMRQRFERRLWTQFAVMALGAWLATAPLTFGYESAAMKWNDIVSGTLIVVLGFLSISYEHGWARWANTVIGIWLLFAPLVFWAPAPAAYLNETLGGTLVIAFALLVPGMPGMRSCPGPIRRPAGPTTLRVGCSGHRRSPWR